MHLKSTNSSIQTSLGASEQRVLETSHRCILALSYSCDYSWVAQEKSRGRWFAKLETRDETKKQTTQKNVRSNTQRYDMAVTFSWQWGLLHRSSQQGHSMATKVRSVCDWQLHFAITTTCSLMWHVRLLSLVLLCHKHDILFFLFVNVLSIWHWFKIKIVRARWAWSSMCAKWGLYILGALFILTHHTGWICQYRS